MASYVDVEALKETLELQGTSFADEDLALALEAATATVDSATGRTFGTQEAGAETRHFAIRRSDLVVIDDVREVEEVVLHRAYAGDPVSWTEGVDYELWPFDRDIKTEIRPARGRFDHVGCARLAVTGKYGVPEVPANIKAATIILATRYLKRARDAPFGVAGIGPEGAAVRVGAFDPDVAQLLSPWTRSTRLA